MTDTLRTSRPHEIQIGGDIDLANAGFITEELCAAVERQPHLVMVVDLSAVTFLDARGLAMMLAVHEHAQRLGRTIRWCGVHGMPARVLSISGVASKLDVEIEPVALPRDSWRR